MREVGAEHDRLDADLGDDALHVLLGERRDDEVLAEDLARPRGRACPTSPCGPCRNAWSILRSVYGSQTVPCSDRHTCMFGKRPKKLCRISPRRSPSPDGRPSTCTHWNASKSPKHRVGILGPVGAVLLVVGRPRCTATRTPASSMRAQNGSNTGSASERPPSGLSRPPCAWPDLIWTSGAPSPITRSSSATREVDVGERDVGRQEHAALRTRSRPPRRSSG